MTDLTDKELDAAETLLATLERLNVRAAVENNWLHTAKLLNRMATEIRRSRPLVAAALGWGKWFLGDGNNENAPEELEDAIHAYEEKRPRRRTQTGPDGVPVEIDADGPHRVGWMGLGPGEEP